MLRATLARATDDDGKRGKWLNLDAFHERAKMQTIVLLTLSNVFMTFAWYGHLKHKESALWLAILASWGIAFFEYCLQVPANRLGHGMFSAPQLKIMQEVITLLVFAGFSVLYLKEAIRWNHLVGFLLILGAVAVVFGFERHDTPSDEQGDRAIATDHGVKR